MELLLGGVACSGAGLCTNPMEVVKTRMQLQGELKARGQYSIHYRNALHAFFTIARTDGIIALQNGLVPALWYQFFMNGTRLGVFQMLVNIGLTTDKDGSANILRSIPCGAFAGAVGALVGSPLYLVKTHLQAQACQTIAVGHQHAHASMSHGLKSIYAAQGLGGLWRGVNGAVVRVMVGSSAQLSTFSSVKAWLEANHWFPPNSWFATFAASMVGGVAVTLFMTPFDVISTRLYNQPVLTEGQGAKYKGVMDCFLKILRSEGFWGFYKGWGPSYMRLGPHTTICLVLWDQSRKIYENLTEER